MTRILYVDDDSDDREMFAEAVRQIDPDLALFDFASGQDLITFLHQDPVIPEFIFVDINMPMMDGHQCVAMIRRLGKYHASTIVMYSTAFSPPDVRKFEEQGLKYLTKPAEFGILIDAIGKLVKGTGKS